MPLRPFSFQNTGDATPNDSNWRVFDESSKTTVRTNLTFIAPVATPTIDAAYFVQYGPLLYYSFVVTLNNNDGWTAGTNIQLPFPTIPDATGVLPLIPHTGQVVLKSNGAIISSVYCLLYNFLHFAGAYTNTSGADQIVCIQGWYFRN